MPIYRVETSRGTFEIEANREPTQKEIEEALSKQAPAQSAAPVYAGPKADPRVDAMRKQWATGTPGERVKMLMGNFGGYSKESAKQMAGAVADAGIEGVGAVGGQAAGAPFGPAGMAVGGFIGGAGGNALAQLRRGDGFSPGKAIGAGVVAAVPSAPLAGVAGRQVAKEATKQALGNVGGKAAETIYSEGRLPTAEEAAASAVGGVVGTGVARKIEQGIGVAKQFSRKVPDPRQQTFREGMARGLVAAPSDVHPSPVTNVLESVAGKASVKQAASIRNAQAIKEIVLEELGLPPHAELTESTLAHVHAQAARPYQQISEMAQQAKADLEALQKTRFTAANRHELEIQMADPKTVREMSELVIKAGADVDALKAAKFNAREQYDFWRKSGDPSARTKYEAFRSEAEALEEKIEQAAIEAGRPDLADELKMARVRLAKAHIVEKALNYGDRNIASSVLGTYLDKTKGKGLTGGLETIAKFEEAFSPSMKERAVTPASNVYQLRAVLAPFTAAMGAGVGGTEGAMIGAAAPFAAPAAAQALLLSKPYQQFMTRPMSMPRPQIPPQTLGQFARMSIQADSRNQPNSFLQFLQTEFPKKQ